MANFDKIVNWENVFAKADEFKNNKPCKFAFIEDFFDGDFYEELYKGYPKFDDSWRSKSGISKFQFGRCWGKYGPNDITGEEKDSALNEAWNEWHQYSMSKEFLGNMKKFSGVDVNRLKYFKFTLYKKGGFQLPHIHDEGPRTLIGMLYFSKNWKKGDPGGTYISTELDESGIIFEPYNLNNTAVFFQDSPTAAHGARYITKNVERRAMQVYLEGFEPKSGWTGRTS